MNFWEIPISINNTLLFREIKKDKEMLEKFYEKYKSLIEKLREKEEKKRYKPSENWGFCFKGD